MIELQDIRAGYLAYKDQIDEKIQEILDSGKFILGDEVSLLERDLGSFIGAHCVSCANGTDGLILALKATQIGSGDEVITTSFSFFATAEAIVSVGARPVFCDISKESFQIDETKIEALITPKTRAILCVSLFGAPCNLEFLKDIAKKHGLILIEDFAQSFGAKLCGNVADISVTSFFPAKALGCFGDGGAIFSNDLELISKIKALRAHGAKVRYEHEYIGMNSRLDALQAGILRVKLAHFKDEIKARQELAKMYQDGFAQIDLKVQKCEIKDSVFSQFVILTQTKERENLQEFLKNSGIKTAIHYPAGLHLQKALAFLGYKKGDFPVTEEISTKILSLPMHAHLKRSDLAFILQKSREFYA
ncbi:MAG: DegT/DnrJ/EryC1/StrS family aminotransferase [Helicobacter sp.]|nr:DegT/DnrJ/EryC1/StrS family aminotransferase [Helicobacter sp.]